MMFEDIKIATIRYQVHQEILRKVIGKYENINQYDKLPADFIERYRETAKDMKLIVMRGFGTKTRFHFGIRFEVPDGQEGRKKNKWRFT